MNLEENQKLKLLVFLPILVYVASLFYFAVNIPQGDDFDNILSFLNADNDGKLRQLFAQHNEHRLFFNRVVSWLFYGIQGEINFEYLIYFANLALIIIFALLSKSLVTNKFIFLLPVSLFMFQLRGWENITWAMAGLQNFYVITFSMLAFYAFSKKTHLGFAIALFFAALATYTSGSGILSFGVMLLWMAVDYFCSKSNPSIVLYSKIQQITLLCASLLVATLYFLHYVKPSQHPPLMFNSAFIEHFLALLGGFSNLSSVPQANVAMFFGGISLAVFLLVSIKKLYLKNPFVFYSILFAMGSLLVVSLSRAGFGVEQALSSRYTVLSSLLLALLYLALLQLFTASLGTRFLIVASCAGLVFNIIAFLYGNAELSTRKTNLVNGLATWTQNKQTGLSYPVPLHASNIMQLSIQKGVYKPAAKY